MYRQLTTRRDLLRRCAMTMGSAATWWGRAQAAAVEDPSSGSGTRLAKEIRNAGLLDVSPDSTRLCLYFTRRPFRSFVWHGDWKEKKAPVRNGEDALRVLTIGTWTSTYAARLPALPYKGSFFAGGEALYAEVPGVKGGSTDHVLIDLRAGRLEEGFEPSDWTGLNFSYWALGDRMLLGGGRDFKLNRTDVLVKAALPSFKETARVPFAQNRSPSTGRTETPIMVSADRRTFAYGFDNNVVYRSAEDLSVLWSHKTDPELELWCVGISARGDVVAASVCEDAQPGAARKYHIAIFDGRDGKELTKLPAEGKEGVAVSPDGTLAAVGQRVVLSGRKSGTQPTVLLFDIASGRKLETLVQDQFYGGGGEFLYAGFTVQGIQFTPDNRYLITSGLNTKVWEIRPA